MIKENKTKKDIIKEYQERFVLIHNIMEWIKKYWVWIMIIIGCLLFGYFIGFYEGFKSGILDGINQTLTRYLCYQKNFGF